MNLNRFVPLAVTLGAVAAFSIPVQAGPIHALQQSAGGTHKVLFAGEEGDTFGARLLGSNIVFNVTFPQFGEVTFDDILAEGPSTAAFWVGVPGASQIWAPPGDPNLFFSLQNPILGGARLWYNNFTTNGTNVPDATLWRVGDIVGLSAMTRQDLPAPAEDPTAVPEPGTLLGVLLVAALMGWISRKAAA